MVVGSCSKGIQKMERTSKNKNTISCHYVTLSKHKFCSFLNSDTVCMPSSLDMSLITSTKLLCMGVSAGVL